MIRAVLDANVMASAFIQPRGPSGQILSRWVSGSAFEMVVSIPILEELRRILEYPRIRKRLRAPAGEIEARLAAIALLADVVDPSFRVRAVPGDPDDDKYVEAALEGRAGCIVSGDRHLLNLREHQTVRMITPREFLAILDAARSE